MNSSIAPKALEQATEFDECVAGVRRAIADRIAARVQAWRELERELIEVAWNEEGRGYTAADLEYEVAKRVAAQRARYAADSLEWFSAGVLELVDEYVDSSWRLALGSGAERIDPPRGAHLRVIR